MKTPLVALAVLSGCGMDLTHTDFLDVIEPVDDGPVAFVCPTSSVFGRVESEVVIDCEVFDQDAQLAVYDVTAMTKVYPDSYARIMKRTTVHVKADWEWESSTGGEMVKGQSWFERIDIGRWPVALAHESLHVYDISHWQVNTGDHPGWNDDCSLGGGSHCNYYRADDVFAQVAKRP